jgi:hypothetical protein
LSGAQKRWVERPSQASPDSVALKTGGATIFVEVQTGIGSFGTGLTMIFAAIKGK